MKQVSVRILFIYLFISASCAYSQFFINEKNVNQLSDEYITQTIVNSVYRDVRVGYRLTESLLLEALERIGDLKVLKKEILAIDGRFKSRLLNIKLAYGQYGMKIKVINYETKDGIFKPGEEAGVWFGDQHDLLGVVRGPYDFKKLSNGVASELDYYLSRGFYYKVFTYTDSLCSQIEELSMRVFKKKCLEFKGNTEKTTFITYQVFSRIISHVLSYHFKKDIKIRLLVKNKWGLARNHHLKILLNRRNNPLYGDVRYSKEMSVAELRNFLINYFLSRK